MDGPATERRPLDSAEMGVIAHLYRGEVYRSTIWRTRLDTTTNWSVVTLGVALWLAYGVALRAWPIVVANAVTLCLAAAILAMKLRYGRSR